MLAPGQTSPTLDPKVIRLVQGMIKNFSTPVKKKEGLSSSLVLLALKHLLKEGENSNLLNWKTAALLSCQFFLTARFEEIQRLFRTSISTLNDEDLLFNFVYAKNKVYHENRKNVLKSIPELGFFNPVFIVLKYFFKIQEINPNHPLLFPKFKSSKGRKILINESLEPWTYDSCAKAYKKVFQELELDVDLSSISGTHSARIGSASEAVKDSSISLFDLKRAGR